MTKSKRLTLQALRIIDQDIRRQEYWGIAIRNISKRDLFKAKFNQTTTNISRAFTCHMKADKNQLVSKTLIKKKTFNLINQFEAEKDQYTLKEQ